MINFLYLLLISGGCFAVVKDEVVLKNKGGSSSSNESENGDFNEKSLLRVSSETINWKDEIAKDEEKVKKVLRAFLRDKKKSNAIKRDLLVDIILQDEKMLLDCFSDFMLCRDAIGAYRNSALMIAIFEKKMRCFEYLCSLSKDVTEFIVENINTTKGVNGAIVAENNSCEEENEEDENEDSEQKSKDEEGKGPADKENKGEEGKGPADEESKNEKGKGPADKENEGEEGKGPADEENEGEEGKGPADKEGKGPADEESKNEKGKGPADKEGKGPADEESKNEKGKGPADKEGKGPADKKSKGPIIDKRSSMLNLEHLNDNDLTPLLAAISIRDLYMVKSLVKIGADFNDKRGEVTPIILAIKMEEESIVDFFNTLGAKYDGKILNKIKLIGGAVASSGFSLAKISASLSMPLFKEILKRTKKGAKAIKKESKGGKYEANKNIRKLKHENFKWILDRNNFDNHGIYLFCKLVGYKGGFDLKNKSLGDIGEELQTNPLFKQENEGSNDNNGGSSEVAETSEGNSSQNNNSTKKDANETKKNNSNEANEKASKWKKTAKKAKEKFTNAKDTFVDFASNKNRNESSEGELFTNECHVPPLKLGESGEGAGGSSSICQNEENSELTSPKKNKEPRSKNNNKKFIELSTSLFNKIVQESSIYSSFKKLRGGDLMEKLLDISYSLDNSINNLLQLRVEVIKKLTDEDGGVLRDIKEAIDNHVFQINDLNFKDRESLIKEANKYISKEKEESSDQYKSFTKTRKLLVKIGYLSGLAMELADAAKKGKIKEHNSDILDFEKILQKVINEFDILCELNELLDKKVNSVYALVTVKNWD